MTDNLTCLSVCLFLHFKVQYIVHSLHIKVKIVKLVNKREMWMCVTQELKGMSTRDSCFNYLKDINQTTT